MVVDSLASGSVLSSLILWPHERKTITSVGIFLTISLFTNLGVVDSQVSPEFLHSPRNQTVLLGKSVLFFCKASGNPIPKVEFLIDGQSKWDGAQFNASSDGKRGASLRILAARKSDHGRVITCRISNPIDTKSSSARLMVFPPALNIPSGFPRFVKKFTILVATKGETAVLECLTEGVPTPRVTWIFDSLLLQPSDDSRYEISSNGNLVIKRITEMDQGRYECQTDNVHGTILSPDFQLVVRSDHSKPVIVSITAEQWVPPGASVELVCEAVGSPIPNVSWHVGSERRRLALISSEPQLERVVDDFGFGKARSILTDVNESINCTCLAKNHLGTHERLVAIRVKNAPRAPAEAPTRISATATSLAIQWSASLPYIFSDPEEKASPIVKYIVFFYPTTSVSTNSRTNEFIQQSQDLPDHARNISIDVTPGDNKRTHYSATLTELKAFTNYSIYVCAVNEQEERSLLSPGAFFMTTESAPDDPPKHIRVSVLSRNALRVFWEPPQYPNGIIKKYYIYYTQRPREDLSQWLQFESDTKTHEAMITHLLSNLTYYIRMSAENSHSVGPVSDTLSIHLLPGNQAVLAKPQNFRGDAISHSEIQMHWESPSYTHIWLVSYQLNYRVVSDDVDKNRLMEESEYNGEVTGVWNQTVLSPSSKSYLLQHLQPNTRYALRLRAMTQKGAGMPSIIEIMTKELVVTEPMSTLPSIPTVGKPSFDIRVLNSTAINITWTVTIPTQHAGFLLYLIKLRNSTDTGHVVGSVTVASRPSDVETTFHHVFVQLIPMTYYRVQMQHVYRISMNTDKYYTPLVRTHPPPPNPPTNLAARIIQQQELKIELKWEPPSSPKLDKSSVSSSSHVQGYRIRIRFLQPKDLMSELREYNVTSTRWEVPSEDLYKGATYEFEVAAFHEFTFGPSVKTVLDVPEEIPMGKPAWIYDEEQSSENPLKQSYQRRHPTSINLKWNPSSLEESNGVLLFHEILCFVDDANGSGEPPDFITAPHQLQFAKPSERWLNITMPSTGVFLENLQENSNYKCFVRAWNRVGPGKWSEPLHFGTKLKSLRPPTNIRVIRRSANQIFVSWQRPLPSSEDYECAGFLIWYSTRDDPYDLVSWTRVTINGMRSVADLNGLNSQNNFVIRMSSLRRNVELQDTGNWSDPVPEEKLPEPRQWIFLSDAACSPLKEERVGFSLSFISPLRLDDLNSLVQYRFNYSGQRGYVSGHGDVRNDAFPEEEIVFIPSSPDLNALNSQLQFVIESSSRVNKMNGSVGYFTLPYPPAQLHVNTRYTVSMQALFKSNSPLWSPPKHITCYTSPQRPEFVPTPVLNSVNSQDGSITVNLKRVDEQLGVIRQYYLLLVPESIRESSQLLPSSLSISQFLREAIQWRTEHGVVKRSGTNKLLSQRIRRSSPVANAQLFLNRAVVVHSWSPNELFPLQDETYLVESQYTLRPIPASLSDIVDKNGKVPSPLKTGESYRAVWMACIKVWIDHKSRKTIKVDELFSYEAQKTLCTASNWSTVLNSNLPPSGLNDGASLLTHPPTHTVANNLYHLIGGIIFGAFICVLVIVAMIFSIIFWRTRQRRRKRRSVIPGKHVTTRWKPEESDPCKQKLLLANGNGIHCDYPMDLLTPQTLCSCNTTSLLSGGATSNVSPDDPSVSYLMNASTSLSPATLSPTNTHHPHIIRPMGQGTDAETSVLDDCVDMTASHFSDNRMIPGKTNPSPIPVCRLAEHMTALKASDGYLFRQEYESIDPAQQYTWYHSNLDCNRCKNRYANVIAYDHSRVVLSTISGVAGSDYINANYLDGYREKHAYIATQGPLPETVNDFWRMVWEQGSNVIVMMTKTEERSRQKCEQYWPSRGCCNYDNVTVTVRKQVELAYFTIRVLELQVIGRQEQREVHHFQYTAWPDHGIPQNSIPLLQFLRRVDLVSHKESGPLVVHCSAGVGRTGTFIVVAAQLKRMAHEQTVDVFHQVTKLRSQRNYIVQTEEQYRFIYEVLLEASRFPHNCCFSTEYDLQTFPSYFSNLLEPKPGGAIHSSSTSPTGDSLLEMHSGSVETGLGFEFARLSKHCSKPNQLEVESGLFPENQQKNRLLHFLPVEFSRVKLLPICGVEGSDYINASFIDGYRNRKAYIATQAPLVDTVEDFWRMLWEHNVSLIVMLTQLEEGDREKCSQYWPPLEHSSRYNYLVVDPVAEYRLPNYVLREFHVTDARDNKSRTVRQFHFTQWPITGVPHLSQIQLADLLKDENRHSQHYQYYQSHDMEGLAVCDALWDLIVSVHKTQAQFGLEGPIAVHCTTGAGRTGVFLALSILLERIHCEGLVDLYFTVRWLRAQRPWLVHTEEQYRFCYMCIVHYLRSSLPLSALSTNAINTLHED